MRSTARVSQRVTSACLVLGPHHLQTSCSTTNVGTGHYCMYLGSQLDLSIFPSSLFHSISSSSSSYLPFHQLYHLHLQIPTTSHISYLPSSFNSRRASAPASFSHTHQEAPLCRYLAHTDTYRPSFPAISSYIESLFFSSSNIP